MNKAFLAIFLLIVVGASAIAIMAPNASACFGWFGCSSPTTPPLPVTTPVVACAPGTHQCIQTVAGCVIEDCVAGKWVHFRTTPVACEVTGIQPSCFPSRVRA